MLVKLDHFPNFRGEHKIIFETLNPPPGNQGWPNPKILALQPSPQNATPFPPLDPVQKPPTFSTCWARNTAAAKASGEKRPLAKWLAKKRREKLDIFSEFHAGTLRILR